MNKYIKHIVEAFDFNSVKKDDRALLLTKHAINAVNEYINKIVNDKILNEINPSDDEIKSLYSTVSIYKVGNSKLKDLINYSIKTLGNDCNLNWIDVSDITDMSFLFYESKFNGDVSKWDVNSVTNMSFMFCRSDFNGDISNWDVSSVINMSYMFNESIFNGNISNWNVSNVNNMFCMFNKSEFNQNISNWDISNKNITMIFLKCPIKDEYKPKIKLSESFQFNKINKKHKLDFTKLLNIERIVQKIIDNNKPFFDLSSYVAVYPVKTLQELDIIINNYIEEFGNNCELNWIDVSQITDMQCLFSESKFNGDISKWDVSNVTNMHSMFRMTPFNQDISNWNVSNVTLISEIFDSSKFNQDINKWKLPKDTGLYNMFRKCPLESNPPKWYIKWNRQQPKNVLL